MKGIFEYEIEGRKIGFKFGMYALKLICEKEGCTLKGFLERFAASQQNGIEPQTLINVFYCCALHYAKSNKKEIDFEEVDVSDWIDEIGLIEGMKMFKEGFEQFVPKNSKSLAETGEITI